VPKLVQLSKFVELGQSAKFPMVLVRFLFIDGIQVFTARQNIILFVQTFCEPSIIIYIYIYMTLIRLT